MQHATTEKQRTNVTLTAANLAAARELGLNVSAISDAAVLGERDAQGPPDRLLSLREDRERVADRGKLLGRPSAAAVCAATLSSTLGPSKASRPRPRPLVFLVTIFFFQ